MKSVNSLLKSHLLGELTSLCTCWLITRTDGATYRFTDADVDVVDDGATYLSVGAYRRSAISNTATLSVDNLEVQGITNDLVLPADELRNGEFDNAEIRIFMTSWEANVTGQVRLRRGFFGETQVLPNGTFSVELRGLMQLLGHVYTDVYTPTCTHNVGDANCGVILFPPIKEKFSGINPLRVPVTGSKLGTTVHVPIRDPNFANIGANGIAGSVDWESFATEAPITALSPGSPNGGGVVASSTGENVDLRQRVNLFEVADVKQDDVETGLLNLNLIGTFNTPSDQGSVFVNFLDRFNRPIIVKNFERAGAATVQNESIYPADFTFETWVFLIDTDVELFSAGTNTNAGIANTLEIKGRRIKFVHKADGVLSPFDVFEVTERLALHKWHHITMARRSGVLTVSVDSTPVINMAFNESIAFDRVFTTGTFNFDETRMWHVYRSPAQIQSKRFDTVDPTTAGLVHYYRDTDGDLTGGAGVMAARSGTQYDDNQPSSPVPLQATSLTIPAGSTPTITVPSWRAIDVRDIPIPEATHALQIGISIKPDSGPTVMDGIADSVFATITDGTKSGFPPAVFNNEYRTAFKRENSLLRHGVVASSKDNRTFRALITEPEGVDGWFNGGVVRFESGVNKGTSMEVKEWKAADAEIELFLSVAHPIEPGAVFYIYPGCDGTRVCCSTIFDNVINFNGTPDIPGEDELYNYPD